MKKNTVVLRLARLTILGLIKKGRDIVKAMTGNPRFADPSPKLEDVSTKIDALETANNSIIEGPTKTALVKQLRTEVELILTDLGFYVQGIANATPDTAEETILSAFMNVKHKGTSTEKGFRISINGKFPGQVILRNKFVQRGTCEFDATTTPDVESSWMKLYQGTKSSFKATELTSGNRYTFRSRITDKKGTQPWTDPKSIVVP